MKTLYKLLFSFSCIATCLYGINIFGSGYLAFVFLAVAALMLLSIFFKPADSAAIIAARLSSVLCLIGIFLGILAGFIGGAFHLSESNEILLFGMFMMAIFGGLFFTVDIQEKQAAQ